MTDDASDYCATECSTLDHLRTLAKESESVLLQQEALAEMMEIRADIDAGVLDVPAMMERVKRVIDDLFDALER